MKYHVILTGDVIHSRSYEASEWLPKFERGIKRYAKSYDIFRGDSFQAEVSLEDCFKALFYLKAEMRQFEGMDVRIGVGVGQVDFIDKDIKKSTGEAFILSGESLDSLTKESLEFRSQWKELDECINLILTLSTRLTDQWTANMAETVQAAMDNPKANQTELTRITGKKHQSQVSTELGKANYTKINQVIDYCTKELKRYVN
ncbi:MULTISPECIES: hypothetical protein [Sphingobacterium]|jgi:hypothetical protein|uniref:hypothetical protein n=1 Tax=Sphingobacterium TaxID=28453 RepID=UPI000C0BBCD6|nr:MULTISPECIES: hypothetical protein [Sphingobacterium]MCT1532608.1 hypothetical protein [Sphingobacterium daejeonense]